MTRTRSETRNQDTAVDSPDFETEIEDESESQRPRDLQAVALWEDDRKCAPPRGSKEADITATLLKSDDETERHAGETLKALTESDDESDRADAARLIKMLNNAPEKALAMSLLTHIVDTQARHDYFTLVDSPKNAAAKVKIDELLVNSKAEQDAPQAVASLLTGFRSNNRDQREDSAQLLTWLNSDKEEVRNNAALYLRILGFDTSGLHAMVSLKNDPTRAAEAEAITKLLASTSGEFRAGRNLLALSETSDADNSALGADRRKLLQMLKEEKSHGTAVDILSSLDSPERIHTMLDLLGDPKNMRASDTVLRMLHAEPAEIPDYRTAHSILDLLGNQHEPDQTDGKKYLKLLNSEVADEREVALSALRTTHDSEYRHHLLPFIENQATRPGVERLIETVAASKRREQDAWAQIIPKLASNDLVEQNVSKNVIKLLAGDEQSQLLAKQLVTKLENDVQRNNLMLVLESGMKAHGAKLLDWLGGTPSEATAARNLLNMGKPVRGRNSFAQAEDLLLPSEPHPVFVKVLPMISDKESAALLKTMANEFDTADKLERFMGGMKTPATAFGSNQILRMLESKDLSDRQAAKKLVDLMQESDFDQNSALLLSLLTDGQSATAKQILNMNSDRARNEMLKLISDPKEQALKDRFLAAMSDQNTARNPTAFAEFVLSNFSDNAARKKVFGLLDAKEKSPGVERLAGMLRHQDDAALTVVRMLAHPDAEVRRTGAEQVEKLASKRDSWSANQLLRLNLSPKELTLIQSLQADRETRFAADHLVNAMSSGPDGRSFGAYRVLRMMADGDEKIQKDGRYLFDMLKKPETRGLALELVTEVPSEPQLRRMVSALQNPAEKPCAEKLLEILKRPSGSEDRVTNPISGLLSKLADASASEVDRTNAAQIFRMLGDKDKLPLIEAMISAMPDFTDQQLFIHTIELFKGGNADQKQTAELLQQLMLSKNPEERAAARRILEMIGDAVDPFNPTKLFTGVPEAAEVEAFIKALAAPATREDATILLGKLGPSNRFTMLKSLQSNDKNEVAFARDFMALLKAKPRMARSLSEGQVEGRFSQPVSKLFEMLKNPATAADAKRALALATEDNLGTISNLMSTPEGRKHLETIAQLEARSAASILSLAKPDSIATVLSLLDDPTKRDAAEILIAWANDPDDIFRGTAALEIIGMVKSADAGVAKTGQRLLSMLTDPDNQTLAEALAATTLGATPQTLLDILDDPKFAGAAKTIDEFLRDPEITEPKVVRNLALMLESKDPNVVAEGRRLLDKLNSDSERTTAIRLLRQANRTTLRP